MVNKRLKKLIKRRRNGEGNVSERKDGYFQASLMINGKRKFEYGSTEKEAYDKLETMREKARHGISLTSGEVALYELAGCYIERYAKPYVKPATLKNYQGYVDNYIENSRIGRMKVSRIAADDVQDFINALVDKGLSGKTIGNIAAFVDSVLAQAVKNHLISYNPCDGIRLPKQKSKERPLLSEEEYARLLTSADTKTIKTGISVLGHGLRIGELLAMQWKDFVEVDGIPALRVSKALKREYIFDEKEEREKGRKTMMRISDPKTESSERYVPLLPGVISELDGLRNEQMAVAGQMGIKFSEEFFIIGSVGREGFSFTTPDKFRADFAKCVKRAGLSKEVTPHALRRYASSTLIRHGASPVAVAKLLGHSNTSTTLAYYSRESLQGTYEAVKLLEK